MKTNQSLPEPTMGVWISVCFLIGAALLAAPFSVTASGTWTRISNFPYSSPGHMLLLSDGSVMVAQYDTNAWFHLTPDSQGHYADGNWSTFTSMHDSRLFYSSDVLQDGRVFVAGGEDPAKGGASTAEIFDPQANNGAGSWTHINPPDSLLDPNTNSFLDSDSILLADGNVLITPVFWQENFSSLIYNPHNSSWSSTGPIRVSQDEATWVKLPDESILTIDVNEGKYYYSGASSSAERYIPSLGQWVPEMNTPFNVNGIGYEMGAGFMLADGRAFFLCGSGKTLYYHPTGNTNAGAWVSGPKMPPLNTNQWPASPVAVATNNGVVKYNDYLQLTTEDAPAAMLPNGRILCELSRDAAHMPVWFYEFDPVGNQFVPTTCPTNNSTTGLPYDVPGDNSDSTSMLDLPDGTVLYNDSDSLYIYQPDYSANAPLASGKPAIQSITWNSDGSLHLTGTLFNGISQGSSYGDDSQQDSNYPLVRFTDGGGNVYYGRTHNWSRTSVQTGSAIVSTDCDVPAAVYDSLSSATYSLQVVANGNASDAITYNGPVWVDFNYSGNLQFGEYGFPYSTLAQGVSAVASGGTIAINGSVQPSQSSETMTISKPMTIVSINGPSTIGH